MQNTENNRESYRIITKTQAMIYFPREKTSQPLTASYLTKISLRSTHEGAFPGKLSQKHVPQHNFKAIIYSPRVCKHNSDR